MKFYSGFSLKDEVMFFEQYLRKNAYTIAGFSYGTITALNKTLEMIDTHLRVDTLQLFSPVFFQSKDAKFKRLQLMAYKKDKDLYLKHFIKSCFAPLNVTKLQHTQTTKEQLAQLLEYEWCLASLKRVQNAGVKIEVYLGGSDAIIDTQRAKEFFVEIATITYIKNANHFLQTEEGKNNV